MAWLHACAHVCVCVCVCVCTGVAKNLMSVDGLDRRAVEALVETHLSHTGTRSAQTIHTNSSDTQGMQALTGERRAVWALVEGHLAHLAQTDTDSGLQVQAAASGKRRAVGALVESHLSIQPYVNTTCAQTVPIAAGERYTGCTCRVTPCKCC